MFSLTGFLKGLLLQNEVDRSKQLIIQVSSGATTGTSTTILAAQTANRVLTLPDNTDTLITASSTNVLTNKSIDATTNTLTNISDSSIAVSAAIELTKLQALSNNLVLESNGSGVISASAVTSTTLTYLDATSSIQTQLNSKQASGSYITALTGDVSAAGPGSAAATVNSVGGSSAANIHSAELTANAATNLDTVSTIVKRDGSGNFSAGIITATLSGNATNVSGTVAIANGGTGQTTANAGFNALSPMTTGGDVIYGGVSGTATRLGNGFNGQVLTSSGGTSAPTWQSPVGAAYFAPTIQKFLSGSGTYTTPVSPAPLYIRVVMVGGGGGGGGGGTAGSPGNGTAGGNTTFGTSLLLAGGGGVGQAPGGIGGNPDNSGTTTLGSGPIGFALKSSYGGDGSVSSISTVTLSGGNGSGGGGIFGGGGLGNGSNAATNSGGGGGGGNANPGLDTGGGGAGGGYVDAIIHSPSATYAYSVGTGGPGGSAGTSGAAGGNGAAGAIAVYEFYQ